MLKRGILFFLAVSILILGGCRKKQNVVIEATIAGYEFQPVLVYPANKVYINRAYSSPLHIAHTNELGFVKLEFLNEEKSHLYLFSKDNQLIVETPLVAFPGDSLKINTSIYNTSRPEFEGNNSELNHFMLNQRQRVSQTFRYNRVNEFPIDEFVAFCDSVENIFTQAINSSSSQGGIEQGKVELINADLQLFIALKRYEYLQHHINETQGIWKYLIPDKDYFAFNKNLIEKYASFWHLPSYSMLVDAMVENDYQHLLPVINDQYEAYPKMLGEKLNLIETKYSGIAQQVALTQLARRFSEYLVMDNAFSHIENAEKLMKRVGNEPTLMSYFSNQLDRISAIKPGNIAPNITLPNRNGEPIALEQFRGKVVLLVFWGTWCPPCLTSIPKYLELQERFKFDEVEIVFIALEARADDVSGWRNFIDGKGRIATQFLKGRPFPGVHLVALGQFHNPQVVPYAVNYAPSYVLIDKQGRISEPRVNLNEDLLVKIENLTRQ